MYQKMLSQQAGGAAASAAADDALHIAPPTVTPPSDGVLVFFGSTNWEQMGKKVGAEHPSAPNLLSPHRLLAGLAHVKVCFLASSSVSAHVIALGAAGEAFAWGRNDAGQLGLGDTTTRAQPTRVSALAGKPLVAAATGKAHTLFVSAEGEVCACGANKQGCVGAAGLKNKKADFDATPLPIAGMPPVASVSCGANFCLARDREGDVWAWGWSEYGVLGNGSDGEYNKSASSVKLSYHPQGTPVQILKLAGQKTVQVACGASHCVSVCEDGTCYTWGNAGFGRIGHRDQKDKWVPCALPEIKVKCAEAGMAHTLALGYPVLRNGQVCKGQPAVYMWGRVNASRDAWMYPKPEDDLRGWNVHAFSVGHNHNVVHADNSVIAWGSPCLSGELGFGEGGGKSSTRPKKVDALEGVRVAQVACGLAHSVLLVERDAKVDALPEYIPQEVSSSSAEEPPAKGKAAGKRKAAAPPAASGKKGKK
ncbi:hypothetical protein AB1Y20_006389 [Prymnesium parvum]|uniref:Uncharacterized protein n=1 Tax=Prymnesium parvum TaxID=97485 RepID=A0AB34J4L5_PRYPA